MKSQEELKLQEQFEEYKQSSRKMQAFAAELVEECQHKKLTVREMRILVKAFSDAVNEAIDDHEAKTILNP